jgi:hypothetical protein
MSCEGQNPATKSGSAKISIFDPFDTTRYPTKSVRSKLNDESLTTIPPPNHRRKTARID